MTLNGEPDSLICLTLITKLNENFRVIRRSAWVPPPPGGTLEISGWGCAAGTLEPLTYKRASSAEFCYPILE